MDLKLTKWTTRCDKEALALELVAVLTHDDVILEHSLFKI